MKKVIAYVDGYNLYHAIDELCHSKRKNNPIAEDINWNFLKWLDLYKLIKRYISHNTQELQKIFYFSAYANHLSESKVKRHKAYIRALENKGITFVEGRFKKKGKRIIKREDGQFIEKDAYEEKESDVNIAIQIIADALLGLADKAIIVTNDSDIAPAIRMAMKLRSDWSATVVTPPLGEGRGFNYDLIYAAKQYAVVDKKVKYKPKILSQEILFECQLPDQIILYNGDVVRRPDKYKVPEVFR